MRSRRPAWATLCPWSVFAFLALAAQYESWLLPLAVILVVPMSILCALAGVWFRGMDNNILTQIGFVVLVALACKNAILIVEFAKQLEDEGRTRFDAAVEACRLRLRPILMTAFAFILGVIPLVVATGAGSEMRRALGTAVFSGMLGVTLFGLFLTPVFYVVLRRFSPDQRERLASSGEGATALPEPSLPQAALPAAPEPRRNTPSAEEPPPDEASSGTGPDGQV